MFFMTLAVYLVATAATALSWNLWSFALFRFFTGAGIGGEYTAINSAIQDWSPPVTAVGPILSSMEAFGSKRQLTQPAR
jgi:MFS family permease